MKHVLLFICYLMALVASPLLAVAQEDLATVSGKVADDKEPIPFASIAVLSWPDSTLKKTTVADGDGKFEFRISPGQYRLHVRYVGYARKTSAVLNLLPGTNKTLDLILQPATLVNQAVEVVARKQLIRQEAGQTVVDVENSPLNAGLDGLEVLRRMPGVSVTGEGDISLRGKGGVTILIDGKPSFLNQRQLTTLLRNTTSNQIKEIQLVTQPDAKYDAQGMAGVINIVLKKSAVVGYQGEVFVSASQAVYDKSLAGFNLSLATEKLKIYGGYSYLNRGWLMDIGNKRSYPLVLNGQQISETQALDIYYGVRNYSNTFRLGSEVTLNKTSIKIEGSGSLAREYFMANSTSNRYDPDGNLLVQTRTDDYNPDRFFNYELSGVVKHDFDSNGHNLMVTAVYGEFNQRSNQTLRYWYFDNNNNGIGFGERYMTTSPTNRVYSAKADYELPLSKLFSLTTGVKFTKVAVTTVNDFYNVIAEDRKYDSLASSDFRYDEQIRAGYAQLKWKAGNWSGQVGLRAEQWYAEGRTVGKQLNFKRDQTFLFPSGSVEYRLNDKQSLSFAYSRRINRPGYGSLNPYLFQMDAFTYYAGNSDLIPALANNFELTYSLMEGALNFSAAYTNTSNELASDVPYRTSDTTRRLLIAPVNIPLFQNINFGAFGNLPLTKWWTVDYYLSCYYNRYSGDILGGDYLNQAWTPMANITMNLSLPWKIQSTVSGQAFGPAAYYLLYNKGFGVLNLSFKRNFMNDKLTLLIVMNDIFWSEVYRNSVDSKWLQNSGFFRNDSRKVGFTLTYRFGSTTIKTPNKEERDTELQRMGGR